jgi:hypothetical protein
MCALVRPAAASRTTIALHRPEDAMNESEDVREISRRTSVPEASTERVLHALRDLVRDGMVDERQLLRARAHRASNPRDPLLVDDLIARARRHPQGIDLLLGGHIGAVAVTFDAHAFTVEAARARLREELVPA